QHNSLGEILDCKVCLVFFAPHQAAVIEGASVARTELDRSIIVLKRAVVLVLFSVGIASVDEGAHILRIEFDCSVEISNGAVVLGFVAVCPPLENYRPSHSWD